MVRAARFAMYDFMVGSGRGLGSAWVDSSHRRPATFASTHRLERGRERAEPRVGGKEPQQSRLIRGQGQVEARARKPPWRRIADRCEKEAWVCSEGHGPWRHTTIAAALAPNLMRLAVFLAAHRLGSLAGSTLDSCRRPTNLRISRGAPSTTSDSLTAPRLEPLWSVGLPLRSAGLGLAPLSISHFFSPSRPSLTYGYYSSPRLHGQIDASESPEMRWAAVPCVRSDKTR